MKTKTYWPRTASGLFDLLWDSLADLLGTAVTATLICRAVKRISDQPGVDELLITHDGLSYKYRVPSTWAQEGHEEGTKVLRALAQHLGALLVELTGPVVVRRLQRLSPFKEHQIVFYEEK